MLAASNIDTGGGWGVVITTWEPSARGTSHLSQVQELPQAPGEARQGGVQGRGGQWLLR